MTLTHEEFLRRFLEHVLPRGLPRIRYFGFYANRRRGVLLPLCRTLLAATPPADTSARRRTCGLALPSLPGHNAGSRAFDSPAHSLRASSSGRSS
jgi:hypothetical protein